MERLSSGFRINSAKDDAAGLAIADSLTTQIGGLAVATRNINDGISMLQTMDGSLGKIVDSLQQMRELAVQALNGTNSSSDLAIIDTGFQKLKAEIDRVALTTSFNHTQLLNGTYTSFSFQVGANVGETVSMTDLVSMRTAALGEGNLEASQTGVTLTSTAGITGAGQFTFTANGKTYDVFQGASIAGDAQSLAHAINTLTVPGISANAMQTSVTGNYSSGAVSAGAADLTLNGKTIALTLTGTGATDVANTITAIRANASTTGVSAHATGTGITLTAPDGRNITLGFTGGVTGANADNVGLGDGAGSVVAATTVGSYNISYIGAKNLPILTIGGSASAGVKGQSDNTLTPVRSGAQLALVDVKSFSNAKTALTAIDNALSTVSDSRSTMGAYLNRFGFTVGNILTETENFSASRSRIQDTNFAIETAALLHTQILQQTSNAMLVQANIQPKMVLALLSSSSILSGTTSDKAASMAISFK